MSLTLHPYNPLVIREMVYRMIEGKCSTTKRIFRFEYFGDSIDFMLRSPLKEEFDTRVKRELEEFL